ncbi:Ig-like domain-containing protein [Candidatus Bipolaricaulota bacterium]
MTRMPKGIRLAIYIALLTIFQVTLATPSLARDVFPDCRWQCRANNVGVELFWVESSGGTCTIGNETFIDVYVRIDNSSSSDLHAAIVLADVYVDGAFATVIDVCLGDISPGITEHWVDSISVDCSSDMELQSVYVSWEPRPSDCGDDPDCSGRSTQCWSAEGYIVTVLSLIVDFEADEIVCVNSEVEFTNRTAGGEGSYAYTWDFGDGETSDGANPVHSYSDPGIFLATLEVTDEDGTSNQAAYEIEVIALPEVTASNGGPYQLGETLELFATGGEAYSWAGPHGFVSYEESPIREDAAAEFAGEYTVRVANAEGCESEISTIVTFIENQEPIAETGSEALDEDSEADIQLSATDPDGDSLEFSILSHPSHGIIEDFNPLTGELTYIPNENYSGNDSFTFEVCDPSGACDVAVFDLFVSPVNTAPTVENLAITAEEDTPVSFQLLSNDPDGDDVVFTLISPPAHGAIIDWDPVSGHVTFEPDPGYSGPDEFVFEACDESGACTLGTATIIVTEINDAPRAIPTSQSVTAGTQTAIELVAYDSDNDLLAFEILSDPEADEIVDFDSTTGLLEYKARSDYSGFDELRFRVCDEQGLCDESIVQIFSVLAAGGGGTAKTCNDQVVISEIAWMGTSASEEHEWIELMNLSGEPIDFTGWLLRWKPREENEPSDRIWRVVPLSGILSEGKYLPYLELQATDVLGLHRAQWADEEVSGFYLLERGSDSATTAQADAIYALALSAGISSAFSDAGDIIELIDPIGCMVDTANTSNPGREGWPAGDLNTSGTMERLDITADIDANWHTNLGIFIVHRDSSGNPIAGTPKHWNSPDLAVPIEAPALQHPRAEFLTLRFSSDLPSDPGLWEVVVLQPITGVVFNVTWGLGIAENSVLELRILTEDLAHGEYHLWLRVIDNDVFFAPILIVP